MSIDGLTGSARYPRLGVLRKGAAKPNDRQPGRDLDQALRFVGIDPDVQASWDEAFGAELLDVELTVRLPYATVDEVWDAWKEHWVAGGLQYRCNGIDHVLRLDPATGDYLTDPVPCPGATCSAVPVGRLEVIVPALERMGTVTVLTTSVHDIKNIDGALRILAIQLGDLRAVPLRLCRVQRMISTPGGGAEKGKRVRRAKWLLHIEPSPEWIALMLPRSDRPALAGGGLAQLPPPGDDALEDDGEALLLVDLGGVEAGFTERIDACGTEAALTALAPDIEAIEEAKRKANVWRLYWRRYVALADRATSSASPAALATIATKLANVPADTEGLATAREHLGMRRDELIEAGVIEPAPTSAAAARQPALVG